VNDPLQPLRFAAAVLAAVVFLGSAVVARGTCEPQGARRVATPFVAP
jgi:hypothetical protein